jgi:hypothetical protein
LGVERDVWDLPQILVGCIVLLTQLEALSHGVLVTA